MAGEPPAACESTNNFFIVNNTKTSQDHGFCEVFLIGNADGILRSAVISIIMFIPHQESPRV